MEKIVKLSSGKEYIVKEVKYKDMVANAGADKETSAKFLLTASTGITDEDYSELSMKDGIVLQKVVNTINGLNDDDFLQEAPKESSS